VSLVLALIAVRVTDPAVHWSAVGLATATALAWLVRGLTAVRERGVMTAPAHVIRLAVESIVLYAVALVAALGAVVCLALLPATGFVGAGCVLLTGIAGWSALALSANVWNQVDAADRLRRRGRSGTAEPIAVEHRDGRAFIRRRRDQANDRTPQA
jgi:hypothetical protein